MAKVLKIKATSNGFRRAGFAFVKDSEITLKVDELTKDQIDQLENEPKLIITELEVKEPGTKAPKTTKTAKKSAKTTTDAKKKAETVSTPEGDGKPDQGQTDAETDQGGDADNDPNFISKAAKVLVDEHKLDISSIKGTGNDGQITKTDVNKVIAAKTAAEAKKD